MSQFCGSGLRRRSAVTSAANTLPASRMQAGAAREPVGVLVIVASPFSSTTLNARQDGVGAARLHMLATLVSDKSCGAAVNAVPGCSEPSRVRRAGMRVQASVLAMQEGEAVMLARIGRERDRERRRIGVSNHDEAAEPHQRQRLAAPGRAPGRAKGI